MVCIAPVTLKYVLKWTKVGAVANPRADAFGCLTPRGIRNVKCVCEEGI